MRKNKRERKKGSEMNASGLWSPYYNDVYDYYLLNNFPYLDFV